MRLWSCGRRKSWGQGFKTGPGVWVLCSETRKVFQTDETWIMDLKNGANLFSGTPGIKSESWLTLDFGCQAFIGIGIFLRTVLGYWTAWGCWILVNQLRFKSRVEPLPQQEENCPIFAVMDLPFRNVNASNNAMWRNGVILVELLSCFTMVNLQWSTMFANNCQ